MRLHRYPEFLGLLVEIAPGPTSQNMKKTHHGTIPRHFKVQCVFLFKKTYLFLPRIFLMPIWVQG